MESVKKYGCKILPHQSDEDDDCMQNVLSMKKRNTLMLIWLKMQYHYTTQLFSWKNSTDCPAHTLFIPSFSNYFKVCYSNSERGLE